MRMRIEIACAWQPAIPASLAAGGGAAGWAGIRSAGRGAPQRPPRSLTMIALAQFQKPRFFRKTRFLRKNQVFYAKTRRNYAKITPKST